MEITVKKIDHDPASDSEDMELVLMPKTSSLSVPPEVPEEDKPLLEHELPEFEPRPNEDLTGYRLSQVSEANSSLEESKAAI